jgi:hypothetical protein
VNGNEMMIMLPAKEMSILFHASMLFVQLPDLKGGQFLWELSSERQYLVPETIGIASEAKFEDVTR